jgi:type IV secretion system protein VirB2
MQLTSLDGAAGQDNAVAAALDWIRLTLTGSLATGVAIIAVASFGLMLLSGRLPRRRGIQLILGCFIIFGASSIDAGISRALNRSVSEGPDPASAVPPAVIGPTVPRRTVASDPYDAYAGAALPPR